MRWRLVSDGAGDGAWNMAVDVALTEAVDRGESAPVLRLYRWAPAALSLGFAQPSSVADAAFCARTGIDVVRRPTGGRAVLHHMELTYLVAAPLGRGGFSYDLQAAYRRICTALVAGLRGIGVAAELSGAPAAAFPRPTEPVPCFVGPAAGEVVVGDRKLVGSAMRRIGGAILQHGSILERWDGRLQAGALGLPDDGSLRPHVTTLDDHVTVDGQALEDAIVAGFAAALGVAFDRGGLQRAESARAALLRTERYGDARWTVSRDASLPPSG